MFEKIIGALFSSAFVQPILNFAINWQNNKLKAEGSHEAKEAEIAARGIDLDKREAELNASIVVAEQGHFWTRNIRPAIATAVVVLIWKLLVWDKALGEWTHGHTDPLGADIWSVVKVIIVSYFGARTLDKGFTILGNVLKK